MSQPDTDGYADFYDPEQDFDHWYTKLAADRIVRRLEQGGRLLELGSATGAMTERLVGGGRQITCVERSALYLERARVRALPGVTLWHGVIEAFSGEGQYDDILAVNVLHELPDPVSILRRVRSWLAPGGRFHVTLPNPCSLHRLAAQATGVIDTIYALSERGLQLQTLRLQHADDVVAGMAELGLIEVWREAMLVKPLPNAAMARLSPELIEAYDALAALLPDHGAMTYFIFSNGRPEF